MKNVALTLTAIMSSVLMLNAQTWNIDKTHSNVGFTVTHFFSEVNGQFTDYSGDFNIDPNDVESGSISFTVKVASVDTDSEKRDGHLMTGDFFNESEYPKMTFESTQIKKKSGNKYVAIGNLTLKDVTKKVEIPFEVLGVMNHPMVENAQLMGVKFSHELMRTAYNVGTGKWAMTKVVGDKVKVDINLELINKKG